MQTQQTEDKKLLKMYSHICNSWVITWIQWEQSLNFHGMYVSNTEGCKKSTQSVGESSWAKGTCICVCSSLKCSLAGHFHIQYSKGCSCRNILSVKKWQIIIADCWLLITDCTHIFYLQKKYFFKYIIIIDHTTWYFTCLMLTTFWMLTTLWHFLIHVTAMESHRWKEFFLWPQTQKQNINTYCSCGVIQVTVVRVWVRVSQSQVNKSNIQCSVLARSSVHVVRTSYLC